MDSKQSWRALYVVGFPFVILTIYDSVRHVPFWPTMAADLTWLGIIAAVAIGWRLYRFRHRSSTEARPGASGVGESAK